MVLSFVLILGITFAISIVWANAIDYMQENHPDYKGKDLFNEDDEQS